MTAVCATTEDPLVEHSQDKASFRIVIVYEVVTDSMVCRFDTKVGTRQHGERIHIASTKSKSGENMKPDDPLIEPKGVIAATAFLADRMTLVRALRAIADNIGTPDEDP